MDRICEMNKNAYNFLAEKYAKEWFDKPDTELVIKFMRLLQPNSKVLDIGCGPGHYSQLFSENGFNVKGIDLSESMVAIAKRMNPHIEFEVMDMQNMVFSENSFDALWLCSSFPHIHKSEAIQTLKGFHNVLTENGIIFVNAIIGDLEFRIESKSEMGNEYNSEGRYFQWYKDSKEFEDIVQNAGFIPTVLSIKDITSNVVDKATVKTNKWINYACRRITK